MHINKLIKITIFVLLAFVLTGCETRELSTQVSNELEEISGVKFAAAILVDGKTGQTEYFKHTKTEKMHASTVAASRIEGITSILVTRVTGVKRENIDENYQFCNYITIDGNTKLICKNNETQESDQSQGIPNIPEELAAQLTGMSKHINNLSFLALTDIRNGETKLFKNSDYEQVTSALQQSISELQKSTSTSIITYKKNPCKQWIIVDGESVLVRRKDIDC